MTTPMLMTQHPTEELLAEFVDNRLDAAIREPVTEHLTSCGECREIVLMSSDFQAEDAIVTHGTFGARRWMAGAASLAAAAVIALFVVPPMFGPDIDDLVAASDDVVAASEGKATRISDGRLAGGFAYSEKPRTDRGLEDKHYIDPAKWKLYQLASDADDAKWSNPHSRGLSKLLIATEADEIRNAVASLEVAHQKVRGEKRDVIAIDLAAALLARARYAPRPVEDQARALDLSNDVLKRRQSPEALWNRAVALELLNKEDEALRAFDDYLKVDSSSKWADEARDRKATIESYR